MAYSADYRKAAIAFKQAGHTFKELKEVFKITPRTYYQWIEILETSSSAKVEVKRTRKRKIDPDALKKAVEEKPDAYLRVFSKMFNCSTPAIYRRLVNLGFTYKKRLYDYQVASKAKKWYSMCILISKEGLSYAAGIVEHP
jgi:transposase